MKIITQTNKIKCDVGNCRNVAEYSVAPDDVSAGQYINICGVCMQELYGAMSPVIAYRKRKARSQNKNFGGKNDKV